MRRGKELHDRLLAAIEQIRPPEGTPEHVLIWRPYRYLTLRYVHALSLQQVSTELGITGRHCRRVHRGAIEALLTSLTAVPSSLSPSRDLAEPQFDGEGRDLATELAEIGVAPGPPAALSDIVRGVLATLDSLIRAAGMTVTTPDDLAGDTIVDRTVARQIVLNLLLSVLRSRPTSQLAIEAGELTTRAYLEIAVAPISDAAEWIETVKRDEHFTIAQHLAQFRGGSIVNQSEAMQQRFRITFPRPCGRSVLLIDDNPDFLRFFRRCLARSDYQVIEASSADEAIQLARERQPTVIVLDILLPDRDGWEILQALKNHRRTRLLPIIICSVLQDRELARSLGANEFLPKPPSATALLQALDRCSAARLASEPSHVSAG